MTALLVSDLHLDATRPAATDCFLRFLSGAAREADDLYILGDLFEAWIGDDVQSPHDAAVAAALAAYTSAGHRAHLLRGNRDFLVGTAFAGATGLRLLSDETVVTLEDTAVLLMHGDTLCTDDRSYQRYRRLVHHRGVQAAYLSLPAPVRTRIAGFARRRSTAATAGKPTAIMDVNPAAVAAALRRHGVRVLVHGHTHRPAIHDFELDGRPARRIVLGDWYSQGSVLRWTPGGPDLAVMAFR